MKKSKLLIARIAFLALIALIFCLTSCTIQPAGTIENVDQKPNDNVQVFRYYFDDGNWVYVAYFKNQPSTQTSTWYEKQGRYTREMTAIGIYPLDVPVPLDSEKPNTKTSHWPKFIKHKQLKTND